MEGEREDGDGDDDIQTLMHAEFEIDVDQRYEALALMKFVIDLHFSILSMPKNLSRKVDKSIWDLKIDEIIFQTGVYILYLSEICAVTGVIKGLKVSVYCNCLNNASSILHLICHN